MTGLSDKECTAKALLALQTRYGRDTGWNSFFEISLGGRRCDFIAFNILPSRDFAIVGCEVKAARHDWLKEKQNCFKADPIVIQCDEWYVVEAREGIVSKEELPAGWGLLSLKKDRLRVKVQSALKERSKFSRELIARIMEKNYQEGKLPASVIYEAEKRGYKKGLEEPKDQYEMQELRRRVKILDDLGKAEIAVHEWELREIKKIRLALDLLAKFDNYGVDAKIETGIHSCDSAMEKLNEAKGILDKLRIEYGLPEVEKRE
jgi:hypothetical protein